MVTMLRQFIKGAASDQKGFSVIEMIMVLLVVSIIAVLALFSYAVTTKMHRPGNQAKLITDKLFEARQRALNQRETMRVEIDPGNNMLRLIDENSRSTATDDQVISQYSLYHRDEVPTGDGPANITVGPPEPLSVPTANFKTSVYPLSSGKICTLRFQSNGMVLDAGTDPIATDATVTGATIYVWSPIQGNETNADIAQAITVIGTTGAIRNWEWNWQSTNANKWQNSRRVVH